MEELNEDCGCGDTTNNIRSYTGAPASRYSQDPLVGKKVSLVDGRSGMVDDSIRNNTGEVIGYVIEGDRGSYRVFKNKISGIIKESGEALASLSNTPGMGDVKPPLPDGTPGSGDQFTSLSAGTHAAKGKKGKSKNPMMPKPLDTSLMDFKAFLKSSSKNQQ